MAASTAAVSTPGTPSQSSLVYEEADPVVWRGNPSQITNVPMFVLCVLFVALGGVGYWALHHYEVAELPEWTPYVLGAWVAIPLLIGFQRWLRTRCHVFELTTQRLRVATGILSRNTHELELYRVRDISLSQPIVLRLFGLGNVVLDTTDHTTPVVVLRAVRGAKRLREQVRTHVERMRDKKRVRHVDVGDGPDGV